MELEKKDILGQKLMKILNREFENFQNSYKFDFYLEDKENKEIIQKIKSFIFSSDNKYSILIIGNKGIGKSYTVKHLLKQENFIFLDLSKLQEKIIFFNSKKKKENFIKFFLTYEFIVFDNLESISENFKSKKIVYLIKKAREEYKKKNIFILSSVKNGNIQEKYKLFIDNLENVLFLNPPTREFLVKIIRNVLSKYYTNVKITESSIFYLSFLLGDNLKILINKLFKLLIFLDSFNYNVNILDEKNLKKILNEINIFKEKKQLINYDNNFQLKVICDKKKFEIENIKSNSKKKNIVFERDQIIYILKNKMNFSILDISKILSKSSSGIFYSLKKIEKRRKSDTFRNYFDYLIDITGIEV